MEGKSDLVWYQEISNLTYPKDQHPLGREREGGFQNPLNYLKDLVLSFVGVSRG